MDAADSKPDEKMADAGADGKFYSYNWLAVWIFFQNWTESTYESIKNKSVFINNEKLKSILYWLMDC